MKTLKWLIAAPILAFILFNVYAYGSIISYRALAPHHTAFMNMRMSEIAQEKPQVALSYQWVPYHQISENLKKALIASEDANFAEHDGFDWNGIKNAIKKNEKSGKIKAGGSTISQQLAKNLFLNESRSYWRRQPIFLPAARRPTQQNSGCPTRRPRAQTAVLHRPPQRQKSAPQNQHHPAAHGVGNLARITAAHRQPETQSSQTANPFSGCCKPLMQPETKFSEANTLFSQP